MGEVKAQINLFDGLVFRLAWGLERQAAVELRRDVYEAELTHHGTDEFDADAYHLAAFDSTQRLVAVTRVITPEQRPFELEQYVDLGTLIPRRAKIAQIGGLAIRGEYRGFTRGSAVSIGLLKLSILLAQALDLSDYVLWALPHLRNFYATAFFEDVTGPIGHPLWGPLWLMRLDLAAFRQKAPMPRTPLLRLLLEDDPQHFPILKASEEQ
jgi:predicted GNAT family N-acyltransferase